MSTMLMLNVSNPENSNLDPWPVIDSQLQEGIQSPLNLAPYSVSGLRSRVVHMCRGGQGFR